MSDWQSFNYSSLMAVLQATVEDDTGVYIPGEMMPSGKPIRATGVTRRDLMKREMTEQWFDAVRGTYEREIDEANHTAVTSDLPDLVIRGEDTAPEQPRRSEATATSTDEDIEETLQRHAEEIGERLKEVLFIINERTDFMAVLLKQHTKIKAALAAMRGLDDERTGAGGSAESGGTPEDAGYVGRQVHSDSPKKRNRARKPVVQDVP